MHSLTPWVKRLLIANAVVYVLSMAAPIVYVIGALVPPDVLSRPWTVVTYMFLHDLRSMWHLIFNMLVLFFFGPRMEDRLGERDFMKLYLGGG